MCNMFVSHFDLASLSFACLRFYDFCFCSNFFNLEQRTCFCEALMTKKQTKKKNKVYDYITYFCKHQIL